MSFCREAKVIFESSDRADKLIEQAFQRLVFHRGSKHIPSECYFMPKSAGEPALEVADFIMHAVGRQARQNLKDRGRKTFLPDFAAVFHAVDRRFVNFLEIESAIKKMPRSHRRLAALFNALSRFPRLESKVEAGCPVMRAIRSPVWIRNCQEIDSLEMQKPA
jgi:hypothetical protein